MPHAQPLVIPKVLFDEEPTTDGALASVPDPKLRRALADRTMLKSYNLAQGEGAAQVPALALLVPLAGLKVRPGDWGTCFGVGYSAGALPQIPHAKTVTRRADATATHRRCGLPLRWEEYS
jgi:hypothetical protein